MSKIEWTDETWNPIIGCSKISAGCQNCYAERMACRLAAMGNTDYLKVAYKPGTMVSNFTRWGWNGKTVFVESQLDKPLKWRKPRNIFVCSMGDLFHESVRQWWFHEVLNVIHKTPQHTYQILTKRPERFFNHELKCSKYGWDYSTSLPQNLLFGVTCENQEMADRRIPTLLKIPAAVRFVSLEPLLGGLNLRLPMTHLPSDCGYIDWVIVGCESIGGKTGRECKLEWVESIVDQCEAADVPVFVKQLPINGKVSKNMAEWPNHLRRREMPRKAGE